MRPARRALAAVLGLLLLGGLLVPGFARLRAPILYLVAPQPGAALMLRAVEVLARVQGTLSGGRYVLVVDGRTVGSGRLHPEQGRILEPGLAPGPHRLEIYVFGPGYAWRYAWRVQVLAQAYDAPLPESPQTQRAIRDVNAYRAAAGIPPLRLSRALEMAAQAHGSFFSRNVGRYGRDLTVSVHDEQPGWPGFVGRDPYGRDVAFGFNGDGDAEVMAFGVSVDDAVWLWMDSVYHRLGLLDPGLTQMGFGMAGQGSANPDLPVTVIDAGFFSRAETADSATVLWPAPGITGVSRAFYEGEIPDPLQNFRGARYPAGYPVTVSFFGLGVRGLRIAHASLTMGGRPVPTWVLTPARERHPEELGYSAAILPRAPLAANAVYRATVAGAYRDSRGWHSFRRSWPFSTAQAPDALQLRRAGSILVRTPRGEAVAQARLFGGTIYLPLSALTAPFGGSVQWTAQRPDETLVTMLGHRLRFQSQNFLAQRDGRTVLLAEVPASAGRAALVPAREFARLLGLFATFSNGTLTLRR